VRTAILDVTGVTTLDTRAAGALLTAARAARLLGTTVILSGITKSVARTLVELGLDFGFVATTSTLSSAIERALRDPRK